MTQTIYIGNILKFDDSNIVLGSVNGINTSSLVGDQLEIDQLSFRYSFVDKSDLAEVYQTTTGAIYQDSNQKVYRLKTETMPNLLNIPYATPVLYYQNNALRAKMYVDNVERVSETDYAITCISAIGLLDKQTHFGGIYTGQTVTQVITDIIGGVMSFSVDPTLASVRVYGWLPIESKRAALHQVLFAHGCNISKTSAGDLYFNYLTQTSAKTIPNDRIFLGGKAKYTPPATRIEVVEHTYFQSQYDETVTLFDNTEEGGTPAGNTFISFAEAPVYDLQATAGLVINSSTVNYAIISGVGVLTGKRYAHQTGLAVRETTAPQAMAKTVSSDTCTLVSMLTSANVTRRLLSYYASAQRFSVDLVRNNETVGDQVQFTSPFGDTVTGFLASMDWKVTSLEKSRADVVTNYEPTPAGGGGYSHIKVVTASGTWSVPSGITDITVVLIGGGQGGQGGKNGTAGTAGASATGVAGQTVNSAGGTGGTGGAAGVGGHAGKVFQAHYEVTAGATLTFSIGTGGTGGAVGGSYGAEGGNTTVSGGGITATSADGAIPSAGYFDVMNQSLYATGGTAGTAGAAGGAGGNASTPNGNTGGAVGSKTGGNAGSVVSSSSATTGYRLPTDTEYTETVEEFTEPYPQVTGYYRDRTGRGDSNWAGVPTYLTCNESNGNISVQSGHYTTDTITLSGLYNSVFTVSGDTVTVIYSVRVWDSSVSGYYRYYKHTKVYKSVLTTITPNWTAKQFAGGGGGASPTTNGTNASNNNGGAGANASAPSAPTTAGNGGNGGNGGGGGGAGGGASVTQKAGYTTATTKAGGTGGAAGTGSAGSAGAAGVALVYY